MICGDVEDLPQDLCHSHGPPVVVVNRIRVSEAVAVHDEILESWLGLLCDRIPVRVHYCYDRELSLVWVDGDLPVGFILVHRPGS